MESTPEAPRRRTDPFVLTEPGQLAVMASPMRHELHQMFDLHGPATVSEVAASMGRPAASLYYHLRPMVTAGILVEVGERVENRRVERIYDVAGRPLRIGEHLNDPVSLSALEKAVASRARLAERAARAELVADDARRDGELRTWRSEQRHVRLGPRALATLHAKLDALVESLRDVEDADGPTFLVSVFASRVRRRRDDGGHGG